jgi:(1->4)-alpha-D-glucan 1-alpha-D-glucosylmutase
VDLFEKGEYTPIYANGGMRQHVCAFLRRYKRATLLVAVPRFTTAIKPAGEFCVGARVWRKNKLHLAPGMSRHWRNVITGEKIKLGGGAREILLSTLFRQFPVALLHSS